MNHPKPHLDLYIKAFEAFLALSDLALNKAPLIKESSFKAVTARKVILFLFSTDAQGAKREQEEGPPLAVPPSICRLTRNSLLTHQSCCLFGAMFKGVHQNTLSTWLLQKRLTWSKPENELKTDVKEEESEEEAEELEEEAEEAPELRECRPSKEVPKPRPGKVPPKGVLRKVPAPNGVPRNVPKKCVGVRASVETSTGEGTRSTFSALSSAPRLGPALSEALFSALFLVGALALL